MNLGLENKKKARQAVIAGVLAAGGLIYLLWFFFSGTTPPPPAAPAPAAHASAPVVTTTSSYNTHTAPPSAAPAGKAAKPVANSAADLDPTLRMEGMLEAESLIYGGSGRNIFSAQSAPPPGPPIAIAPARPKGPPPPPPVYVPPPPPPPPPIDLKFFGTAVAKDGSKRAFLLHGEDVFLAGPGDIVDRRYKIVNILATGIVIEDLPNNNTQTVPLTQ